ncbi:FabD/lysophospholipase-like protein [Stipitochalara longipes BDJ]|nr:FabD/lysophospholipase-like protein [Stipitochalara longipes BDJ]
MSGRRLRLLCFDGGGVRGLASLFLLKQILTFVGNPKPHEFFDMIAGTSTGGLIAIMLGRLQMSVDECIEHYAKLVDEIFNKKRLLPFKLHNGSISSRYATSVLEKNIKDIIEISGRSRDEKMREVNPRCKVFVVALTAEGGNAVRFTNYQKLHEGDNLFKEAKIWEAARATSSAPTFFDPIDITCNRITQTFVDGALGHNNPVNELWMEAQSEFGNPLEPQIRFILSIGTGRPALKKIGSSLTDFGKTLIKMTVETQRTANTFHRVHQDLVDIDGYFRFNPPDLDEVGLDEASKKGIIQQRTAAFGQDPDVEKNMKRFGISALDPELPMRPVKIEVYKERQPVLFSMLDRTSQYIRPGATSYWNYLTLESYRVYEKIHGLCVSHNGKSGMVHISSFLQQMERSSSITRIEAIEVWSRLLRLEQRGNLILNSQHPKAFVMAVLYMLHVEMCFKSVKPRLEDGEIGIDMSRREALKRFTKWVRCSCQASCKNEWNFANDTGISRGGDVGCRE